MSEQSPVEPDGHDRPGAPDPQPPSGPDAGWRRLHPLSPIIRSWQAVVVVLVVVGQDFGQNLISVESEGGPDLGGLRDVGGGLLAGGTAVVLLLLLGAAFYAYLSWRLTRYRITEDAMELHSGVLSRQQRRARLDRVQAVDVVQPFLARLAGLARLTLEVAGGGNSNIQLSYLTEREATSLRNHLLARAAGVRYETEEAPQAPEHEVVAVHVPRLVGSLVLSGAAVGTAVLVLGLVVAAIVLGEFAPVAFILPGLIGAAGATWARFTRGFGFRVATSPDGLRLRHGLLEQRAQTVPPGRVQAIRLQQPLLWRRTDWWRLQVNIAGYGPKVEGGAGGDDPGTLLLPVGTREEALAVVRLLLPELVDAEPGTRAVVGAGLSGSGHAEGFVTSPRPARWLDPFGWRRTGYRVTRPALLVRRGVLTRTLDVVPHARTQSLAVSQGPLQRRLGLASFTLHSTPGPVGPAVPHLDAGHAGRLLAEQAVRAQQARLAAGPERWMERAAVSDPDDATPPEPPPPPPAAAS